VAPFDYDTGLKRQLVAVKFRAARAAGRALGLLLADAAAPHRADVDALVPVPLHAAKLRRRGYNQAAEIARSTGTQLELPVLGAGLRRLRGGPPQIELRADARRSHPRGAFAAGRCVAGLRIAVIDDVITTGATVNACADALLAAGAGTVQAWAVARTAE
jgi:ComF family protein